MEGRVEKEEKDNGEGGRKTMEGGGEDEKNRGGEGRGRGGERRGGTARGNVGPRTIQEGRDRVDSEGNPYILGRPTRTCASLPRFHVYVCTIPGHGGREGRPTPTHRLHTYAGTVHIKLGRRALSFAAAQE